MNGLKSRGQCSNDSRAVEVFEKGEALHISFRRTEDVNHFSFQICDLRLPCLLGTTEKCGAFKGKDTKYHYGPAVDSRRRCVRAEEFEKSDAVRILALCVFADRTARGVA